MADITEILRLRDDSLNYANFKSDHQKRFNAYVSNNMATMLEFQKKAVITFKDMDAVEELNTFFEIEKEQVLNDCDFHIINFQGFRASEQDEKVSEILDRAQQIIITDQKNIEIDFKAIDNLNKIKDFYEGLESEKNDILKRFADKEKTVTKPDQFREFQDLFFRAENLLIKMMKCLQKIRRTQLTITIEDVILSDNVENFNRDNVFIQDIVAVYTACEAFYSKMVEDFDELLNTDLTKPDKGVDDKILYTIKLFHVFLNEPNNKLEQFFTLCYVFRDRLSEIVMDDTSLFLSLILKKITAFKSIGIIDYYETTLKPLITKNIAECKNLVQKVFDVPNIEETFNTLSSLNFAIKNVLEFLKLHVANKKTTPEIFDSDYLNRKLDSVLNELNEFTIAINHLSSEIAILEVILQNYDEYRKATQELKTINTEAATKEDMIKNQLMVRKFKIEQSKMHKLIDDLRGHDSKAYAKFADIIEGNQNIMEEFRNIILKAK